MLTRQEKRKNSKKTELFLAVLSTLPFFSCSSNQLALEAPLESPAYTQVPHPESINLGDLKKIFLSPDAPKNPQFAKTCDSNFKQLMAATVSKTEQEQGVLELLKNDPVYYHWCFYKKLDDLEEDLKQSSFIDDKQKNFLTTFEFLTPIAKGFSKEYHDTRYLRWATARYQKLSEWVFFRPLVLTPRGTLDLVEPENPFGLWQKDVATMPVLEKYAIRSAANAPLSIATPNTPPANTSLSAMPNNMSTPPNMVNSAPNTLPLEPAASPATSNVAPNPSSDVPFDSFRDPSSTSFNAMPAASAPPATIPSVPPFNPATPVLPPPAATSGIPFNPVASGFSPVPTSPAPTPIILESGESMFPAPNPPADLGMQIPSAAPISR